MSILHIPLFASPIPRTLGVGFHNVGSEGVLRASNEAMIKYVQHYYGERCGHLPLNARNIRAVVSLSTAEIQAQMAYLSTLFGKEVTPITHGSLILKVSSAEWRASVEYKVDGKPSKAMMRSCKAERGVTW